MNQDIPRMGQGLYWQDLKVGLRWRTFRRTIGNFSRSVAPVFLRGRRHKGVCAKDCADEREGPCRDTARAQAARHFAFHGLSPIFSSKVPHGSFSAPTRLQSG